MLFPSKCSIVQTGRGIPSICVYLIRTLCMPGTHTILFGLEYLAPMTLPTFTHNVIASNFPLTYHQLLVTPDQPHRAPGVIHYACKHFLASRNALKGLCYTSGTRFTHLLLWRINLPHIDKPCALFIMGESKSGKKTRFILTLAILIDPEDWLNHNCRLLYGNKSLYTLPGTAIRYPQC